MFIALRSFGGEQPRKSRRTLSVTGAQKAEQCNLWNDKLRPWYAPRLETRLSLADVRSVYRYTEGGYWFYWQTDVDVVRGPIAEDNNQRIYYTGDGAPKVTTISLATGVADTTVTSATAPGALQLIVASVTGFSVDSKVVIKSTVAGARGEGAVIKAIDTGTQTLTFYNPLVIATGIGFEVREAASNVYPIAFYDLGVPIPATALTASNQGSTGTVVAIDSDNLAVVEYEGPNDNLIADIVSPVNGSPIEIIASMTITGIAKVVQTVDIRTILYRDRGTALEEIVFEETRSFTVQGYRVIPGRFNPNIGEPDDPVYVPGEAFRLVTLVGESIVDQGTVVGDTPTYELVVEDEVIHDEDNGEGVVKAYVSSLDVRYFEAVSVELNDTSNLQPGDRIQFTGVEGDGTLSSINGVPLEILLINEDTNEVQVETDARGVYDNMTPGVWRQVFDVEDLVARTYVYTFVAQIGQKEMEGPPSPASSIINVGDGQTVNLSNIVNPETLVDGRPYTKVRIYRTEPGSANTDFLFVGEIDVPNTTFVDNKRATELGEVIVSTDWIPPPADLQGLVELPDGGMAGFRENELWFAEPYQPHAWPVKYVRVTQDKIVGLGVFGSSMLIATEGRPYIMIGIQEPTVGSLEETEVLQPCLSKRGLVDMGYAVVYPSPDGLVMVQSGSAQVITESLVTTREWNEQFAPSTMVAARYDDRYVGFYDDGNGTKGGFIFDPKNPGSTLVRLKDTVNEAYSDQSSGELFLVTTDQTTLDRIDSFDGDRHGVPDRFTWRSKAFASTRAASPSVALVEAVAYPVTLQLICDGEYLPTITVYSNRPHRVNAKNKAYNIWEVEVTGNTEIEGVYVAESMRTLGRLVEGDG